MAYLLWGGGEYRNEIIWHYRKWSIKQGQFVRNHDVIFFYSKTDRSDRVFNQLFMDRAASTLKRFGKSRIVSGHDESGRRLPSQTEDVDSEGVAMDDVWDIGRVPPIKQLYPTQKPDALLERIITASSNEGDTILDAYCGCGTTVMEAQRLGRKWIGIDITYQSIALILRRLEGEAGKEKWPLISRQITLNGIPRDIESARALALKKDDRVRKEFEKWAVLTYTSNRAIINDKKGADAGIDGIAYFQTGATDNAKVVFQVKSGHVGRGDIAKLRGDMEREKAAMAVFITLEAPTAPMNAEAKAVRFYHHAAMAQNYDKIQIVTINEIIEQGKRLQLPMSLEVLKAAQLKEQSPQLQLMEE